MAKINLSEWRVIVKLVISVLTAILGAMGASSVMGDEQ